MKKSRKHLQPFVTNNVELYARASVVLETGVCRLPDSLCSEIILAIRNDARKVQFTQFHSLP